MYWKKSFIFIFLQLSVFSLGFAECLSSQAIVRSENSWDRKYEFTLKSISEGREDESQPLCRKCLASYYSIIYKSRQDVSKYKF